jgi:multidrug resistance efflux pump
MAKASKAKNISAGVGGKGKKAPMVDPKGAWTKVQERTLGAKGKKSSKKK